MKIPTSGFQQLPTGPFNTFAMTGVSMLWGHMLGLLNLWFIPLTVLCLLIGYGSELRQPDKKQKITL